MRNNPCPNCGTIDYEDECGFCALSVKLKKETQRRKEAVKDVRELLLSLQECIDEAIPWYQKHEDTIKRMEIKYKDEK